MKKVLLAIITVLVFQSPSQAQLVNLVFGPLDGDSAGVLRTYENATVDVDVWFRTAEDIEIIGLHLPLSTNDNYIVQRNGGVLLDPIENWEDINYLDPNDDPDNDGYTNQSLLGICAFNPPDCVPLETHGDWLKIATFKMTSGSAPQFDTPLCDAFLEGYQPDVGGLVLVDYQQGELDPSQYEVDYACLEFVHSCGDYIPGDYNGNGSVNVADLVEAFSWIRTGAPEGAVMCYCPPDDSLEFAVAMDLNNDCRFDIVDICVFIKYLPDYPHMLQPCEYCPPE